ncbi:MAG: tetratricopeptide repeat protein [Oligoflexia bacterium]|nr:tetratricopeptide repeat protein [Oligoflexia bacterium]
MNVTSIAVVVSLFIGSLTNVFGASLITLESYSRIEMPIMNSGSFELVSSGTSAVILDVSGLSQSEYISFSKLKDQRISDIKVERIVGQKARITISLKEPGTESFAYLQKNNLVIDLWKNQQLAKEKIIEKKKAVKKIERTQARKIASVTKYKAAKAIQKTEEEIEVNPLKLGENIFLRFNLPLEPLKIVTKNRELRFPPEASMKTIYEWSEEKDKELSEAQKGFNLALKLFNDAKYALSIKSIELTQDKNPSKFLKNKMNLLRAIAYDELATETKEESLHKRADDLLKEEIPNLEKDNNLVQASALARIYFAKKYFNQQNWLKTADYLEKASAQLSNGTEEKAYALLLLAEAYLKLNQNRRAERLYRVVSSDWHKSIFGKEAAFRLISLLASERNYSRVIDDGQDILRDFADYRKNRLESLFQIAEAFFWQKNYPKAIQYLKQMGKEGPYHTVNSLAMVRLGELSELVNGNLSEAEAYYQKTIDSFPFTYGANVAQIRQARLRINKEKEVDFMVSKIKEIMKSADSDQDLYKVSEIVLIDYLLQQNSYEEALSFCKKGKALNEGSAYNAYNEKIKTVLVKYFKYLVNEEKYVEALGLFENEKNEFQKTIDKIHLDLAKAYSGVGLFDSANREILLAKQTSQKGSRTLASAAVSKFSDVEIENSFRQGDYRSCLDKIQRLKSIDQSDVKIMFYKAISHFRLNDNRSGIEATYQTIKANGLSDQKLEDADLYSLINYASTSLLEDRDFSKRLKILIEGKKQFSEKNIKADLLIAETYFFTKDYERAIKEFKEAFSASGEEKDLERSKYYYGLSLIGAGKKEEGVKVLTEISEKSQGIWAESAKQEIGLVEWESKYSTVLKTLPPSGVGLTTD